MNLTRAAEMKLSRLSQYAAHALAYLAKQDPARFISADSIAGALKIPDTSLKRLVLRPLSTARLVLSLKGPSGGYRLGRPSKSISLLEIVEVIDGPIHGDASPVGVEAGARLDSRLQKICDQTAETLRQGLEKVKVADLAKTT